VTEAEVRRLTSMLSGFLRIFELTAHGNRGSMLGQYFPQSFSPWA
jgi:hypothetical protein